MDDAQMVVCRSSVKGAVRLLSLGVCEASQAEPLSRNPADKHHDRHCGQAARKANPDADAVPVLCKGEPAADAQADYPIAEQGEEQ